MHNIYIYRGVRERERFNIYVTMYSCPASHHIKVDRGKTTLADTFVTASFHTIPTWTRKPPTFSVISEILFLHFANHFFSVL